MCIFSRPIELVAGTRIFARPLKEGRQALVYQMQFAAVGDVAMILPLPVPPDSPEDAVEFVSLEHYPKFFADVDAAFPDWSRTKSQSRTLSAPALRPATLKVHDVGEFEASFVPKPADFARLDERFRLPEGVLHAFARYADYGFAVFKLRSGEAPAQKPGLLKRVFGGTDAKPKRRSVHPMALTFPRRDARELFFPTVHVHDGNVPSEARFDHQLYCQVDSDVVARTMGWEQSEGSLGDYVKRDAKGLTDGDAPAFKRTMLGSYANTDAVIPTPKLGDAALLRIRGTHHRCDVRLLAGFRHGASRDDDAVRIALERAEPFACTLATELERLLTANAAAWGLAEHDEQLPRCQAPMNAVHRVLPMPDFLGGPAEAVPPYTLDFWTEHPRGEGQVFVLAFAEEPSFERAEAIRSALRTVLDDAVNAALA